MYRLNVNDPVVATTDKCCLKGLHRYGRVKEVLRGDFSGEIVGYRILWALGDFPNDLAIYGRNELLPICESEFHKDLADELKARDRHAVCAAGGIDAAAIAPGIALNARNFECAMRGIMDLICEKEPESAINKLYRL